VLETHVVRLEEHLVRHLGGKLRRGRTRSDAAAAHADAATDAAAPGAEAPLCPLSLSNAAPDAALSLSARVGREPLVAESVAAHADLEELVLA